MSAHVSWRGALSDALANGWTPDEVRFVLFGEARGVRSSFFRRLQAPFARREFSTELRAI